jgi:hypothetical protein
MFSRFPAGTLILNVCILGHGLYVYVSRKQLMMSPGINVYCYAFLNIEKRSVYAKMFELIFEVLGNVSRSPVRFAHIGNGDKGVRVTTMDMCKKQAPGK